MQQASVPEMAVCTETLVQDLKHSHGSHHSLDGCCLFLLIDAVNSHVDGCC